MGLTSMTLANFVLFTRVLYVFREDVLNSSMMESVRAKDSASSFGSLISIGARLFSVFMDDWDWLAVGAGAEARGSSIHVSSLWR